jgi:hypothetical protein
MLDYKCAGLYMVSMIINKNAYKIDLPKTMSNYSVLYLSQLDHYPPRVVGQPSPETHPAIGDDSEELDVLRILDSNHRCRKLANLIQWAGNCHIRTRWDPFEKFEKACDLMDEFHRDQPNKRWS